MRIARVSDVEAHPVAADGAVGCTMQELLTARDGAPTFAMRRFVVEVGGRTPYHSHPWEHEVFILAGEAVISLTEREVVAPANSAVLIEGGETHSFMNRSTEPLAFLCLIPVEKSCCR